MTEIPMEVAASLAEIPMDATINTIRCKSGSFSSSGKSTVSIRDIGFIPKMIIAVYIGTLSSITSSVGISFILSPSRNVMEYLRYSSSATSKIAGINTTGIIEHTPSTTKNSITIESGNSSVTFRGGSWFYMAFE